MKSITTSRQAHKVTTALGIINYWFFMISPPFQDRWNFHQDVLDNRNIIDQNRILAE